MAHELWGHSLRQYVCVGSSRAMREMGERLRHGNGVGGGGQWGQGGGGGVGWGSDAWEAGGGNKGPSVFRGAMEVNGRGRGLTLTPPTVGGVESGPAHFGPVFARPSLPAEHKVPHGSPHCPPMAPY